MLSIKQNITNETTIKKSKFITYLFRVDNINEVKAYLGKLKKKHDGADHICFAYIIDNIKRFNDDGEPSKTAGMPILNVLESNNLNHVLCCVVRYFGGIKLGANGLLRAYSNCASTTILKSDIVDLIMGKKYKITFDYENTKTVNSLLKNTNIIKKEYENTISYIFEVSIEELEKIKNELEKNSTLIELNDCYIEKDRF